MQLMKQISFLPEPKYNPKYPPETSLAAKALRLMLRGMRLSHPHFESLTGSWRLAAHVHILKKLGWPIQKDGVSFALRDKNNTSCMGIYYLPEDLLFMMKNI